MQEIINAFKQRLQRRVNKTFGDVQLAHRYFKVDPKLRGDKVEVAFDPFSKSDTIDIYSLQNQFLGTGTLHFREPNFNPKPEPPKPKPKYNYLDLLIKQHQQQLEQQINPIDYRVINQERNWPFHEFAKSIARLLGYKGELTAFTAEQLESLKKVYNQSTKINQNMLKQAYENAYHKSVTYIIHELKLLIKGE